jgi:hypothetical protein
MADRIYLVDGYTTLRYVGYQADARAELGGEYIDVGYYEYDYFESPGARATLVCNANRFKLVSAVLTSTATVSAVISHIEGADLQAFNTALLTASVSVTKEALSSLSATATTSVAGNRLRFAVASLASAFTQTASVQRNRFADSALSTSATFVCDAEVILGGTLVDASGSWNATASLTVNTGVIRSANVELTSTFTQTATIREISGLDLFAFTDALLAALVQRLRDNNIAASSAFTIATDNGRIRYASAEVDAAASLTANNARTRNNAAALDAAFSLTADVTRTRQVSSSLTVTATVTASSENVKDISATLSSTATVSATISHLEGADLQAFTNATLSATAKKTVNVNIALASAFTQTSNAGKRVTGAAALQSNAFSNFSGRRIRFGASALSSAFTVTAPAVKLKTATASLTSAFTQTTSVFKVKFGAASLNSTATLTAAVDETQRAFLTSAFTLTASPTVTIGSWRSDTWFLGYNSVDFPYIIPTSVATDSSYVYNVSNYITYVSGSQFDDSIAIIKRDLRTGAYQWTKTISADGGGSADIAVLTDNVYVSYLSALGAGVTVGSAYIEKFNSSGASQWRRLISSYAQETKITTDAASNIYVVNSDQTRDHATPRNDLRISKFNESGTQAWSKILRLTTSYGSITVDYLVYRNSYIYVTYETPNSNGYQQTYLAKIDTSGTLTWNKKLPSNFNSADKIDIDADDNIWLFSRETNLPVSDYSYIVKFDSSGNEIWSRKWNDTLDVVGTSLPTDTIGPVAAVDTAFDASGNIYIIPDILASPYGSSISTPEKFVLSLDPSGAVRWVKTFSPTPYVYPTTPWEFDLLTLAIQDDRLIVAGSADSTEMILNVFKDTGGISVSGSRGGRAWSYGTNSEIGVNSQTNTGLALTTVTTTYSTGSASSTVSSSTVTNITPTNYRWWYAVDMIGFWSSAFTQTTNNTRRRQTAVTVNAAFTQSTTAVRVVRASAALTSAFTQTTSARKTARIDLDLPGVFTQTANNTRTRNVPAALSAAFTLTANPFSTVGIVCNTASAFTQTTNNTRTRALTADLEGLFAEVAIVSRIGNGPLFAMDSSFALSCEAVLRSGVYADLRSNATVEAIGSRFKLNEANLTATATLTVDITKFRPASAALTSAFTQSATTRIDTVGSATLTSAFTQTTNNLRVRYNTANLNLVATVSASAIKSARPLINLQSTASLAGFGTNVVNFNIAMTAFNTQVTVANVFRIDPYYQIRIKPETRFITVTNENRLLTVKEETRTRKIRTETRILTVLEETRLNTIKGYPDQ